MLFNITGKKERVGLKRTKYEITQVEFNEFGDIALIYTTKGIIITDLFEDREYTWMGASKSAALGKNSLFILTEPNSFVVFNKQI